MRRELRSPSYDLIVLGLRRPSPNWPIQEAKVWTVAGNGFFLNKKQNSL